MLVAGISYRPTGHGKCGLRSLSSLINYLAGLSYQDVLGLVSPINPFRCDRRHTCDLPDVARR